MDEIVKFCQQANVDALMIKFPNLWRTQKTDQQVHDLYHQFISEDTEYSRYQPPTVTEEVVVYSGSCPFIDKNGVILWNGDITVCCYDHDGKFSFGNINDPGGYEAVLESQARHEAWEHMGDRSLPICQSCDATGLAQKLFFNPKYIRRTLNSCNAYLKLFLLSTIIPCFIFFIAMSLFANNGSGKLSKAYQSHPMHFWGSKTFGRPFIHFALNPIIT